MPPDPLKYGFDVPQAVALILRFVQGRSLNESLADDLLRAGVERELITIGEALNQARQVDPSIVSSITDSQRVIDFRNVMVHGYDVIDQNIVRDVIQQKLPPLKAEVDAILSASGGAP